jgi:ER lumen protein retaining receptor
MIGLRAVFDLGYSSILTLGSGVQCLGFYTLIAKVQWQKSMHGISEKTLKIYAAVFTLRLMSTLLYSGYLPVDRSGDFVYQFADALSLACVLKLIHMIRHVYVSSYQAECDTMDILRLIPGCVVFAVFIHGNLNNSFLFDTIWTLSMNLDTVALLPQLWMLSKLGEVECMTSHFVFAMIVSRTCAFAFWWYGYTELARSRGPNLAGWQLLAAHGLQLLLSLDFLYYYAISKIRGHKMQLPVQV